MAAQALLLFDLVRSLMNGAFGLTTFGNTLFPGALGMPPGASGVGFWSDLVGLLGDLPVAVLVAGLGVALLPTNALADVKLVRWPRFAALSTTARLRAAALLVGGLGCLPEVAHARLLWINRLRTRGLAWAAAAGVAPMLAASGVAPASGGAGPTAPGPQPRPAFKPAFVETSDREFLPAALEILATPPSPVAMSLLLLICAAFCAALAWATFGSLDIHAVAPGKIQPSGRSKVVQPFEPGKIVAIHVDNGSKVRAGDLLLELDATETQADREAQARDFEAASAEAARRNAAIAAAAAGQGLQPPEIQFTAGVSPATRRRETIVLAADLGQLRASTLGLRAQLAEKQATKERLSASIAARQKLVALAQERVSMREEIGSRGSGSRAMVIEAMQQLETQLTTDAGERGQLIETDAAIRSLEHKVDEALAQFLADQTQRLAEVERKRDRLEQEVVKATSKSLRTQLRAPIAGSVQQLAVSTVGQVVTMGQSLLTIVPNEGPIEVEALIANKDIGFVKGGQPAVVKIEAFPFTRYGAIEAEVVKISRDAVDDRDAANLSDSATAAKPQPVTGTTNGSRTQSLVFPATLKLGKSSIRVDGETVPLSSGMAVSVEIKTGQRRVIDYILSPLREITVQSAHER